VLLEECELLHEGGAIGILHLLVGVLLNIYVQSRLLGHAILLLLLLHREDLLRELRSLVGV
jgi:hypothetical protein